MALFQYELIKGADTVVKEGLKLREGELLIITADTASDERVVDAIAQSAFTTGAKFLVVWSHTPRGTAMATDRELPVKALVALLSEADAWIELNKQYLLYSSTYNLAAEANPKLRFYCLPGVNVDVLIRCFARIDLPLLNEFLDLVAENTRAARHVRMTTPAGQDVEFDMNPAWPIDVAAGYAGVPGSHMFPGQISWTPAFDSVNGTIVFDGSILPDIGILNSAVKLRVEKDRVVEITGAHQAAAFENWLRKWDDPQMFKLAHTCYGFNPGAMLTGQLGEDERVWGCTQWGMGSISRMDAPPDGVPAASHVDGICLNASVFLDDRQITDRGRVIDKDLRPIADKLLAG